MVKNLMTDFLKTFLSLVYLYEAPYLITQFGVTKIRIMFVRYK